MARFCEGAVDFYTGDGIHQNKWASISFARLIFNLVALL